MSGHGWQAIVATDRPLELDCGCNLSSIPVAFSHYGELSENKDNAILVCHALSGDQFVCSTNPITGRPGWWETFVGPGKVLDTDRFFVICSNVLGGCMGTMGPNTVGEDGYAIGMKFPFVTVADMVRLQEKVVDYFGIPALRCVVGGSMGGMQVLEWLRLFPSRVIGAMIFASSHRCSPQNISFNFVGRKAIMNDPEWRDGNYKKHGTFPRSGLAVARMLAHITYMSPTTIDERFSRRVIKSPEIRSGADVEFDVESYLEHQGLSFVDRFDPNSYIYITRAIDFFDISRDSGGYLSSAFHKIEKKPILVGSFSSDWLFTPGENEQLADALSMAGAAVEYHKFETDRGHDAFLLDEPEFTTRTRHFINKFF